MQAGSATAASADESSEKPKKGDKFRQLKAAESSGAAASKAAELAAEVETVGEGETSK